MDVEQIALKLQETTDRSERNEGRIKKPENEHEVLHQLATSVAVMAEKMDTMNKSVDSLASKVDEMESKPANRWESIVDKLIWLVAGAFAAWVLSGMPGV